jgi:predicted RecB family nuclease
MSLRAHISATQLSEFYSCPRRAYFTDRIPAEKRDPLTPLSLRITTEGERFEGEIIRGIDGVVSLDKKILGLTGAFEETKRQMKLGVQAIHHGILLGEYRGVQLVCEPDLLERTDGKNDLGDFLYRVVEIKNSPAITAYHHLQLSLNVFILEGLQGQAVEHFFIDHHLHRVPYFFQDFKAIFFRILESCLDSLSPKKEAPLFTFKSVCPGCAWESICLAEAKRNSALGLIPGIQESEVALLQRQKIETISELLTKSSASALSEIDPHRLAEIVLKAKALSENRVLKMDLPHLLPPKLKVQYLLLIDRDKIVSKTYVGFAALHLVSGQFLFWAKAEDFLNFLLNDNLDKVLLCREHMVDELRDHFLLPQNLGSGEMIYTLSSVEGFASDHLALPSHDHFLPSLSKLLLSRDLPIEPLEVFADSGLGLLYENALKDYLLAAREILSVVKKELA